MKVRTVVRSSAGRGLELAERLAHELIGARLVLGDQRDDLDSVERGVPAGETRTISRCVAIAAR